MSHELFKSTGNELSGLPYIEQYFGTWAMLEDRFNALRGHAQQINVQLHLEKQQAAEAGSGISARSSSDVFVTRDRIAIVEVRGTMMKHASSFSSGASTVAARRQIRAAMNDEDVAGILLVIDSPGGTVAGTDDLGKDIAAAAARKPTFTYAEDLMASAGYWIGSQANKIYANATALIGSIGVFNVVYDLSKMAEEEGVEVHVVRFGEFKGAGMPGTKVTEAQLGQMKSIVDAFGDDFVDTIAKGRGMSRSVAEQLADGRVHKGQAAVDLKLVDGIQSLDDTLAELVSETQKPKNRSTRAMSKETTKPAAADENTLEAVVGELKPTSASLADLKQALPDASSDFLVEQMEANATVEQAQSAYVKQLAAENKQLKEAAAKAPKEDTPAAGNEPLDDTPGDSADSDGTATEAFSDAVDTAMTAKKLTRPQAVAHVARKSPELREAMVAEQNAAAGRK